MRTTRLLAAVFEACRDDLPRSSQRSNFSAGIEAWMRAVFACNQYVDEQAPWALRKTDPERMRAVLMTLFMAIRDLTIAIRPVVPTAADAVLDQLGIPADARRITALTDADWFLARVVRRRAACRTKPCVPRLEMPEEHAV